MSIELLTLSVKFVEGLNDGGAPEGNLGIQSRRECQRPCVHLTQLWGQHAELIDCWAIRKSPLPADFGEDSPVQGRELLNRHKSPLLGNSFIKINVFRLLDGFGLGLGLGLRLRLGLRLTLGLGMTSLLWRELRAVEYGWGKARGTRKIIRA